MQNGRISLSYLLMLDWADTSWVNHGGAGSQTEQLLQYMHVTVLLI
jgi:hypothetical protein